MIRGTFRRPRQNRLGHLLLPLLLCAAAPGAAADVLVVPGQFATIQAAIDAAQPGDTVMVEPGLYTENITLRSGIDVRGEETALTLLRADDLDDYTVRISAVDDVLFANFTLLDSDWGVGVENSTDVIIANNVFDTLDEIAVDTDAVSSVDVMNNVFFDNVIAVWRDSPNTWIFNNIFAFNIETLVSSEGDLHSEVSFNCFHENDDLGQNALGTNFQVGDPLFVDVQRGDFHLRLNSPCIDAGTGTDVIDDSVADIGAYGGPFADPWPFPVPLPQVEDTSAPSPPPFNLTLTWEPNLDYRVSNPANPGSYRIYYRLNEPGPPYDGADAGSGTLPSPIEVEDIVQVPERIAFELENLMPTAPAPATPQLLSAEPRNQAVVLEWSEVAGATAYRVFYGTDGEEESQVDVDDQTTFTLSGLENGVEYTLRVAALARAMYFVAITVLDNTPERHESVFSDEQSIQIGDFSVSPTSNTLVATPDEVAPEPDLPDDGRCFIATAAFSDADAVEVAVLRAFRDRYLRTHEPGRRLVAIYYALSPAVARQLDRHPQLKPAARAALRPAVVVALVAVESPAAAAGVLGLVVILAGCAYTRRRSGARKRMAPARRAAGTARP